MGRESKSWLPVVSTSDYVAAGDFISNALAVTIMIHDLIINRSMNFLR